MRILIVDDEPLARARLAALLGECDGVEIIGSLGDGEAALGSLGELHPDVLAFIQSGAPAGAGAAAPKLAAGARSGTKAIFPSILCRLRLSNITAARDGGCLRPNHCRSFGPSRRGLNIASRTAAWW